MKRIVICLDGTWNKPADENLPEDQQVETNVRRFYESVLDTDADGTQQLKWYDDGVGTHWFDHAIGGAFGVGLDLKIIEGYRALAQRYDVGDEVYVLGFSRGAYTARSLVGMIRNCGLVKNNLLDLGVGTAYGIYRTRGDSVDSFTATRFRSMFSREIGIKFVGVWDTVGALGIPLDAVRQFNMEFYEFHDTQLSRIVENAYQAIAIDENRKDYDICLWDPKEKAQQAIEQRWFVGAHCNVGGGYPERELSDMTLRWMQDKASALGLAVNAIEPAANNYLGQYTDSYINFINGVYARLNPRYYRTFGTTQFGNEIADESVSKRRKEDATYTPQNAGLPGV
jgi:uncharacterized protein (DUF2235 family)